jgi:general secretion pathway protein C
MSILGIRIANLLLFVLSCFLVANIVTRIGAFGLIPVEVPSVQSVAPAVHAARPWSKRKLILDRNLFGAQVVAEEEIISEPEPEETLQETKLPLRLLGTVASDDQVVASAAIENTQDRVHQVVRVGHTLTKFANVIVTRIDRGRVVLQNGAQREELLLDSDAAQAPVVSVSRRSPRPASRRRAPEAAAPSLAARLGEMAKGGRATSVFSGARILPKYEGGKMTGIELNQVKSDSLFQKVGLKNGDVINSINGVRIDNPSAQRELLTAFTSANELVAEVTSADGTKRQVKADAALLSNMMSEGP